MAPSFSSDLEDIWLAEKRYGVQQKKKEWLTLLHHLLKFPHHKALEIGSYTGGSTLGLSHIFDQVISIDIIPLGEEIKAVMSQVTKVIQLAGYSGDGQVKAALAVLLGDDKLDFLFIDGGHDEATVEHDYNAYSPYVKAGGWIGFHDIVDSPYHQRANCFVSKVWSRVKQQHDLSIEILSQEDPTWGGIGLVQLNE